MTALVGTVVGGARWEAGQQFTSIGHYTLVGAIAEADTITWTGLIPDGGVRVDAVILNTPELDTNASPTGTLIFGDVADPDRFMTASGIGIAAASLTRIILTDNRAFDLATNVGAGATYSEATALVATVAAAVATAASTGAITVKVVYTCVGNA